MLSAVSILGDPWTWDGQQRLESTVTLWILDRYGIRFDAQGRTEVRMEEVGNRAEVGGLGGSRDCRA